MARETSIPHDLIGMWECVNGDYPLTQIFRADGTLISLAFGRDDTPAHYRIEADVLIVPSEQADGSIFEQKSRFEIDGDTLYFHATEYDDLPPTKFRRVKGIKRVARTLHDMVKKAQFSHKRRNLRH